MKKIRHAMLAALTLFTASMATNAANSYGIPDNIQDGNILHCFDWTFNDIKAMLPQIAEAGFGAVQVSPVQGNAKTNAEWYYAYMPYDFKFIDSGTGPNGNGSKAQLTALCTEAEKYGIKIVVDVVANHVNDYGPNHDPWWNSNDRVRWEGGCNYGNRYSITHGQLGQYGDVNSELAEVQQRAKTFVEELKSIGVKGIRWDAAKHIGLPSEGCNFWSTVTSVSGMYHYGEILDGPGGDGNALMKEYTKYMSVTDNGYSNKVRSAVCSGNVPSEHAGWAAGTITDNKVVYWGESHDDYSNEWQASTNIPQDKIDRTWAIGACRAGAVGLYFSRPSATSRNAIKMGQKGSTHFTSKEIAAINHLRNAAVGTKDYYSASNGIACITREGVGAAIIIGSGGSRQVTVSNGGGYVPAGTYTDEVSGNQFTVTASTISGQVGNTGIAVIYGEAKKIPSMTFNPNGGSFRSETLSVTATLTNATSGWYKIDGGAQVNITGSKTFTIGEGVDYGKNITVSWSATGEEGTKTGSVTFTKQDPNAVTYIYYNNPKNWSAVNAYIYSETAGEVAKWPGSPMAKDPATGLWYVQVPDAFVEGGMVIFNGGGEQYPTANEPGLPINGKSMICRDNTVWQEYTGNQGGGNQGGNQGGGNQGGGNQGGDTSENGYYVYLSNTYGWNAPSVWAWNDEGNCTMSANWPGDMMTKVGDLWKWTAPNGKVPTKIIFSNSGNSKTGDLDYVNKATYDCSGTIIATGGNQGGGNQGGGNDTPITGDFKIYFDNSNSNWATPHIHYWGGSSNSSWPGVAMNKVSGNIWVYTVSAGTTGCLFNAGDGDATKTKDFQAIANHLYDTSNDKGVYSGGNTDPDPTPDPDPDPDPTPDPDPDPNPNPDPTPVPAGTNLITDYYKVNPNGKCGTNKTINVTGHPATNALSNWTDAELIAQGVARDVCQAFRGTHERPVVDSYALYAAYDAQNLYIGVQYVYTVWDEYGEGFQGGESKPYNMDGKLCIAFDLNPSKKWNGVMTTGASVWQDKEYTTFDNGVDAIFMGSTKPGVGTPGFFVADANGKCSYTDPSQCKAWTGTYGYADGLLPSIKGIYGQKEFGYDPALLEGNTGFVDLTSEISRLNGNASAHTFYEFKFPYSLLGINENYIKTQGIGVMVVDFYGSSAHASLPYDPSFYDNVNEPYSPDPSSSGEKEDKDVVKYAPARIGRLAFSGVEAVAVDNIDAAPVYYNLQGVRIDNPAPGRVYIEIRGNKARKVVIR